MSILSWNCRGAGSSETVQRIRDFRRQFFPDFLFLMETKQKFSYMDVLKSSLGYDNLHTVEPIGRSGGLGLMWKSSYGVDILYSDKRIIDLKITIGSLVLFLSCVYGDPVRGRRRIVWDKLSEIGVHRDEAWMLVGDFNELMHNDEKLGGAIRDESTFWDFRNMVEACKIREMRSKGNTLSWSGWRDKVWVQCRLDISFGNDEWFRLFPQSSTEYLSMWPSDHRPLKIDFALEPESLQRGRFYFDKRMYGKRGVEEAIIRGWDAENESPNLTVLDRIARCRTELAKLKKINDWNSKTQIERLQNELDKESSKQFPQNISSSNNNSGGLHEETVIAPIGWTKPPRGYIKCNIGSSWVSSRQQSGASWILRDEKGKTIMHRRRAYSFMRYKTEADLWSLYWAVECMQNTRQTNIIFEASSGKMRDVLCRPYHFSEVSGIVKAINNQLNKIGTWSLDHALPARNEVASAIAVSVTRDRRYQSYIAHNAPVWLQSLLTLEAQSN
ncbi:hypothetical protein Bca101_011162 [Brassica carinata]